MLEKDLAQECRVVAKAMGAFLSEVGQRRAKGSGTTIGYPDMTLMCAGKTVLIELKRIKVPGQRGGVLSVGQKAYCERAAEQGVRVFVVDCVEEFVACVNSCRRRSRAEA